MDQALFSAGLEAGLELDEESDLAALESEPLDSDDDDDDEADSVLAAGVSLAVVALSLVAVADLPRESVR